MLADRRHDERLRFCMEECRGTFTLESADEKYEIEEVRDISLGGIGFDMTTYLDPDTPVSILYEEDGRRISVTGRIVWCQDHPSAPGRYRLGVMFDYSYRDESGQLLLAVKDYIDTGRATHLSDELDFE